MGRWEGRGHAAGATCGGMWWGAAAVDCSSGMQCGAAAGVD